MSASITNPSSYFQVVTLTKIGDTDFSIPWSGTSIDTMFFIKRTNGSLSWYQLDGLRGYDKYISSNNTNQEVTDSNVLGINETTGTLKSTLPDGNYVIYMWRAGAVSARQTNTSGTITSTVSVNTASGFSIVTYATPSTGLFTFGHGLGTTPQFIVNKNLSSTSDWRTWHIGLTGGASNINAYVFLNQSTGQATSGSQMWVAPTSTTFGGNAGISYVASANYLSYCFAEVNGFSKFGTYVGNGSTNGPFVYCGFKPRWVLIKNAFNAGEWYLYDTMRDTYNLSQNRLFPNQSFGESPSTTNGALDILSNGFKQRTGSTDNNNANAQTYLYFALAQNPFGGSNVSPANAR